MLVYHKNSISYKKHKQYSIIMYVKQSVNILCNFHIEFLVLRVAMLFRYSVISWISQPKSAKIFSRC